MIVVLSVNINIISFYVFSSFNPIYKFFWEEVGLSKFFFQIYPVQQYFSIIQINLTMILPLAVASLSEMFVSLERIQGFMELGKFNNISNGGRFGICQLLGSRP